MQGGLMRKRTNYMQEVNETNAETHELHAENEYTSEAKAHHPERNGPR